MGVNLPARRRLGQRARRPHARGGEPPLSAPWSCLLLAVPTPVGVNLRSIYQKQVAVAVPTPVGVNLPGAPAPYPSTSAVPTPVGVNLPLRPLFHDAPRRPHARGGEPMGMGNGRLLKEAVPTPVGVNRLRGRWSHTRRWPSPRPWG